MGPASNPCSRPKRHLRRFTGMDPENLQSYPNPYVCFFRVKRDDVRWPKIAKGGPPSAHGRSEVPQVRDVPLSPIWVTVRNAKPCPPAITGR